MKQYVYTSILQNEFNDFLRLRCDQGFKDKNSYTWQSLDQYLNKIQRTDKEITAEIVEDWISDTCQGLSNGSVEGYITAYNTFAKYLISIDIPAYIQIYSHDMRLRQYVPYVFSSDEMDKIFRFADEGKASNEKLSKIQIPVLLRILYGCGLRLGEALGLKLQDIDFNNGTLIVRNGKGSKDRLVPMDESLTAVLQQYYNAVLLGKSADAFLFESNYVDKSRSYIGQPRSQSWARHSFQRLLRSAGISTVKESNERGICLHCLRHTFIEHSLAKQNSKGISSYQALPLISVYVGHEKLSETQDYVHMTDDTSELILEKVSESYTDLFPGVPL